MDYNPSVIEIWQNKPINEQFRLESEEKLVWMQYTGLKDKNGKKIFEGDIVRNINGEYSYIGIVNKDRYTFYIKGVAPEDNYDFADVSDTVTGKSSLIVIGNIHENPELLEEK
ncbi:YopX family protein [Listeria monocytogenes]